MAHNTLTTNPPPRHPNMAHNIPLPPTRHAASTRHAIPRRPATLPQRGTQGPAATSPHAIPTRRATPCHPPPTPTPPRHGAQHPATCRLTATLTQHTPRLRHVAQDPADPPRHLNMARKAATTNPMTCN
ncbi:hypothetical protein EDB86DRAFT_2831805 [Lactarius hatsudake]|nr:hypothetical protein EDB86DRAFT_2831805 [Lactarius hatsudake]